MTWYQQLAISLCGGVVAALLTTRLALQRFYRERSWQKRFDACGDVVSALHELKRLEDLFWNEEFLKRDYRDEYREMALKRGEEGWHSLRRFADLGPLALPNDVSLALKEFVRKNTEFIETFDPNDRPDAIEATRNLIDDALKTIPDIAATALGLERVPVGTKPSLKARIVQRIGIKQVD